MANSTPAEVVSIENTPLKISVYSVKDKPLRMHGSGKLEIIFCLSGTVTFAYAYEEFKLNEGEYVSVDRDAYYLHSDEDNICVSFFIDLMQYKDKYPDIDHMLFVCEGCKQTTIPYPTVHHDRLRGKLIALLKYILDGNVKQKTDKISAVTESLVDLFVHHFDIAFFHAGVTEMNEDKLKRVQSIFAYIDRHLGEKITLNSMSDHLGLSSSYLSEFMRKTAIGFRGILAYERANRSEWYLINTEDTIVEISEACGFSDPQYYYKAFKRWYKCTPRQFRELYIKQSQDNMKYYDPSVVRDLVENLLVEQYMDIFLE